MAMKLFSHVLRSEIPGADADEPATSAAMDAPRWVFRDLVVRRDGYASWGLSARPATNPAAPTHEPVEASWPDTQPWCHK